MELILQHITSKNYENVADLELLGEQKNFLASNTWSLVEAAYNDGYEARAIYQKDKLVGFIMWVHETEKRISIWRFMVDHKFQNQGIGRSALNLALNEIKLVNGIEEIEICYNPDNSLAKRLFFSCGFKEVGMDKDNEDMLAVITI
ncbi:GNAT family N-acetyltransferase [Pseudoalteromonas porphyrae]|uniref:GCN5 family acetyltransferase n=1 Tax=Pseudoalteromonas porphyrae TaxID=187330 RepID=A0A0N1EA71_9GAMM|nr:GNAT family N-acetyltransferase [Pseudoalteromonas porphyrae]KPH56690.1 GCN5 family acetyltransferase [Pseudoalteromonas porphyrae]